MRGVLVACLVAGCALGPRPPAAPPRHTSLGLGIGMTTLHNGLRVVLVHDERAPEVQVTMRYRVGAIDDGDHPGIAHLAEHLMFEQVLGKDTLFAQLEQVATYFNALTTFDATTYVSRAPKDKLDRLLSIEGVRLGLRCTSIAEPGFEREREVVINEVRQRDDATELFAVMHDAVYPEGHPYRRRLVGTVDTVSAITLADACHFVDAHYAPSNAVLVVSGNITSEELETSLNKFIARVAPRQAVAPAYVPSVHTAERKEVPAPVDDDAILAVWPLPPDPAVRRQIRSIGPVIATLASAHIEGSVLWVELGDEEAPEVGVIAVPSSGESYSNVQEKLEKALEELPSVFLPTQVDALDSLEFDGIQQSAIFRLYSGLEDGSHRDIQLATYVLENRDPEEALAAEFQGVRDLRPAIATDIANRYLAADKVSIVKLAADPSRKRGHDVSVRPAIHDMGKRRTQPDVAAAHIAQNVQTTQINNLTKRRMPNGLNVVLVPITSVPTVDVRLVFNAGSADDPVTRVGSSLLAAYGLDWNLRYVNDLLAFLQSGSKTNVDVTRDHTTFEVQGLDMHLDYLLAGMRRWVLDGDYEDGTENLVTAMRVRGRASDDRDGELADAWRAALYGPTHPYVHDALKFTSNALQDEDAEAFRLAHYTPDNATLIISGHFDPVVANHWLDYLFAGWSGHAVPRSSASAHLQPASIAMLDDIVQAQLRVAMPATGSHAEQLVAAEMLNGIADGVRQELGATYGVHASLVEQRQATHYELAGWVDASRAEATIQFIAAGLQELRTNPDAAARAFVLARERVLSQLGSVTASGAELGAEVEHDVDLGREPFDELGSAVEVATLTIDHMKTALDGLDLAKAAVLVRGPKDVVDKTFAAIARTPTIVKFDQVKRDEAGDDPLEQGHEAETAHHRKHRPISSLEPALTDSDAIEATAPRQRWTIDVLPSYVAASYVDPQQGENGVETHCCSGVGVNVDAGYRLDPVKSVGLHLGTASVNGYRTLYPYDARYKTIIVPIDAGPFLRAESGRLWGAGWLGLHLDHLYDEQVDYVSINQWSTSLGVGLFAGFDVLRYGPHKLGVSAQLTGGLGGEIGYASFSFGISYRQ